MGDLEQGLWGSNITASLEPTISHTFVTAMFKGDSGPSPGHMAIKGGDAQGGPLTVYWDGPRPNRYAPMKKQGGLILCVAPPRMRRAYRAPCGARTAHLPPPPHSRSGIGGDNSNGSEGTFYEGAVLKGFSTDAADAALQADIVAAKYSLQ